MTRRRPRLRSLRNKLALLVFIVTAGALGVMYFAVVPQLESNLRDEQIDELMQVAENASSRLEELNGQADIPAGDLDREIRAIADAANARLTLLGVQQSALFEEGREPERPQYYLISDSTEERTAPRNDPLATRAVRSGRLVRGSGRLGDKELSEIAQPVSSRGRVEWVALYSRSFDEVTDSVALVRNRLLAAGAAALLLALLGGYAVAQMLTRRVRRLEEGARSVAAGHFIEPLPVRSEDELGQLTRAFNEMQSGLQRVDKARKEFVATASHELRTPIFSLGGFVELLRDEELDEPTRREFLEAMTDQVERLQKLAVDLLDLSRLDAGSVELERERVDLGEVARAVAGEFTPAVKEHRTKLDLRLPGYPVAASCDRERVAQIMRILLDNAIRHTPEGTPVTVTAARDNGAATLTVADQGPGIPSGTLVFERFITGDAVRGAGLGLAIARELAGRMDGSIEAAGVARGSAFVLRLPVDEDWRNPA